VAAAVRRVHCPALGREVELPARPARIVSLSPSLTDAVWTLGLGDRLGGRSAWCWRPPEVRRLPVVGSYTEVREDRLAALEPDLVLAGAGVQDPLVRRLADAGWPVYQVPLPASPWGIVENLVVVAAVCGEARRGLVEAAALHRRLLELRGILPPLATYAEIDLGGPVTTGLGSYVTWALAWLGLEPVTREDPRAYFTPDLEWLRTLDPELVILDPQPHRPPTAAAAWAALEDRGLGGWRRHARLVVTEGDVLAHHGPWLIREGLPALAASVADALARAPRG